MVKLGVPLAGLLGVLSFAPASAPAVPAAPAAHDGASEVLDVWMVPHAHCDVGWLMSVDGYFNPSHYDGSENRTCNPSKEHALL